MMGFLQSALMLLCVFGCHCARIKHSEFVESWRVPDDATADWPSPDQVYFELGESLDAELHVNVLLYTNCCYKLGSLRM